MLAHRDGGEHPRPGEDHARGASGPHRTKQGERDDEPDRLLHDVEVGVGVDLVRDAGLSEEDPVEEAHSEVGRKRQMNAPHGEDPTIELPDRSSSEEPEEQSDQDDSMNEQRARRQPG